MLSPLDVLQKAEKLARELTPAIPKAKIYVGICGPALDFDSFSLLGTIGAIRKVTNAPGIVHVCRAANLKQTDYLGVSRYSLAVRGELAFGNPDGNSEPSKLLDMAWHTAALIKLRGHTALFCPALSSVSWDVISAVSDNSVTFGILDDVPRQIAAPSPKPVSLRDVEWAKSVWGTALELRDQEKSRRFGLAFNLAYIWNQTFDPRIAITNLWCGLESLFGDKTDRPVTRKIVERICNWLPSSPPTEVQELYNLRCDACHGR